MTILRCTGKDLHMPSSFSNVSRGRFLFPTKSFFYLRSRSAKVLCRTNSTSSSKYAEKKLAYPERLLIYHAGTGRTVFIGCLKVTTIFVFSFFCLIVAPAHWFAEDEPVWMAPAVVLSGAIPMLFVAYTTAPFVTYVHLRLPLFARHSREIMTRYSRSLPKDAALDITTMNFVGKPRVNKIKLSELYPTKERFGIANYARDTKVLNSKRPWWMGKAVRIFGIRGGAGRTRGKGVWETFAKGISVKG